MAFCFFESLFPVCTQNGNFWPNKKQKNKNSVKYLPAATARSFSPLETSLRKTCMNSKALKYNEKKQKQIQAITTWKCVVGNKISLRKLREIKKFGDDYIRVNLNTVKERYFTERWTINSKWFLGWTGTSNKLRLMNIDLCCSSSAFTISLTWACCNEPVPSSLLCGQKPKPSPFQPKQSVRCRVFRSACVAFKLLINNVL